MKQGSVIFAVLVFLWLVSGSSVEARSQRVGQLPNGSTFGCANCHVNAGGGGARNAFGQAIGSGFLNGSGAGASVNWNATIAAADADGDGVSNGTELGDPDGDGTPTAGAMITNPGDATSFPQVVNRPPTLASIDAQYVLEGETLSFNVTGTDADGDALTITATGLPEGATFEDGTFAWLPGFDLGGTSVAVTFTVSDGTAEASASVDIAVSDVNRPLVLNTFDPPRSLVISGAGTMVTFTADAADPDGEAVTFAWIVNGAADAEASKSLTLTIPDGTQDETVSVTATSADGSLVTQYWTVGKTLIGDFDSSGDVGFTDFLAFSSQFGKTSADIDFDVLFDLDSDGSVGFGDFLQFVTFFGLTL